MLGDQYEQIGQLETELLRPIHHVQMCAVHGMIVNNILTFEHHHPPRFKTLDASRKVAT